MVVSTEHRSRELLEILSGYEDVVVVTHDYPDPDAIATGWAVRQLVERCLSKPVRLLGRGDVLRAENRYMLRLLRPPLELVDEISLGPRSAVVLVDCGAEARNHSIGDQLGQPVAVLDHHEFPGLRREVAFRDVRPRVAAAASIATSYLREQEVEPGRDLATALLYAIHTETCGGELCHSPVDRAAVVWLTELADLSQLAHIENAPLKMAYFSDLALALQSTFVYDGAAFCILPTADCPEIVGEVADLLIRATGIQCVCCGALFENDLFLSVRTERVGDNAADLVLEMLQGLGHGGGHEHRAGGKVLAIGRGGKIPRSTLAVLRGRWLAACRVDQQRGTRLVPKREIIGNL